MTSMPRFASKDSVSFRTVPARAATALLATLSLLSFSESGRAQATSANLFTAAGFVARAANTPEKMRRLRSFPPYRFVTRRSANGPYYVYADPELCVCAYVGTPQALEAYRRLAAQGPAAAAAGTPRPSADMSGVESQMIDDMDRDGVETPFNDDSLF